VEVSASSFYDVVARVVIGRRDCHVTAGDCWFIAAVACLAVSPKQLIERAIPGDQHFQNEYAGNRPYVPLIGHRPCNVNAAGTVVMKQYISNITKR